MRPSLRFLSVALVGWAGVRAATLGALPGAEMFSIERSEAKTPPMAATEFPPIEPVESVQPVSDFEMPQMHYDPAALGPAWRIQPVVLPVAYPAAPRMQPQPAGYTSILPQPRPAFYSTIPPLDEWPLSRIAATSMPPHRPISTAPMQSTPAAFAPPRIDRIQLSAWALLRGREGMALGTPSLASGGTLGGSQAGARLAYNFTREISASLRTSSDVGRRGGEVAAGLRVQPVPGLPVWFTAERRQRLSPIGGGRNAFALFAEAGVFQRPLPWNFSLDAYLQGGVVGIRSRDRFIDGSVAFSRPLFGQFSGGFGMWGAAQSGVYRLDGGPRVSMKLRNNMRVHLDWRQRLAGNAQPGSGPAITLAGDF